jgi:hypothetical protein
MGNPETLKSLTFGRISVVLPEVISWNQLVVRIRRMSNLIRNSPFDATKEWAPREIVSVVDETIESKGPRASRSRSQ